MEQNYFVNPLELAIAAATAAGSGAIAGVCLFLALWYSWRSHFYFLRLRWMPEPKYPSEKTAYPGGFWEKQPTPSNGRKLRKPAPPDQKS